MIQTKYGKLRISGKKRLALSVRKVYNKRYKKMQESDMTDLEKRYIETKRALFRRYYGATLNDKQTEAVCTAKGPLLILAGAGSGKTTVLVRRIAHLIKYGTAYESCRIPEDLSESYVAELESALAYSPAEIEYVLPEFIEDACPPWAILAITFTNKAAREIKERLEKMFDGEEIADEVVSGTFHAVCLRILRKYGDTVGLHSGFTIYDTDDKKKMVLACMRELGIDEKILPVKTVANAIGTAKDQLVTAERYVTDPRDARKRDIAKVYALYEKRMAENNAVDFDDIILKTVMLLTENEEARGYYQRKFRYVLVDEYQDTNYAQFRLSELLSGKYRNIMAVGDDDQSIYKFRGATIENILNFDRVYTDAKIIKLEQNYRSTKNILAAANAVISHNSGRHDKSLWCDGAEGDKVALFCAATAEEEAKYIVDTITRLRVYEKRNYSDFAVLYRVNELSRGIESAFAKSGMPYRVLGGQRFYDRKEIRDMTAYLCLILNHNDSQRLLRIVNEPKRKIGDGTLDAVSAIAAETGLSMFAVMTHADEYPALQKTAARLMAFTRMIENLSDTDALPSELLSRVYTETGYEEMLLAAGEAEKDRVDAIREYIGAAVEYERRLTVRGETPTLLGFLEEVALVSDVDKYDENADAVVLMTVHSAKGLEFPIVFLAGMEERIFPSMQSIDAGDEQIEEERRLAYVAITRAKEKLFITHTGCRRLYGSTAFNMLSRFVAQEIPRSLIEETAPVRPDRAPENVRHTLPKSRIKPVPDYRRELSRAAVPHTAVPGTPKLLAVGTRVTHALFGNGTILTAKPAGGDILYEIAFDSGETKRLMATYAKLREI